MYAQFFGLKREPFSIAPDPRYLFMSERHREALAHLLYGLTAGGGFVLLTGEIGAGKTTVCRCFLEQIPKRCNVAYIFNPKLTVNELLQSICNEFHVPLPQGPAGSATVKDHVDPLNEFLLQAHAIGQNNILIIDEAQNLSPDVLEQLRLLTNLETSKRKLLQVILIGQPELRTMLERPELEQLAQRIIARYHLEALSEAETAQYIRHRLAVAGLPKTLLFDRAAVRRVYKLSRGVPRRINLLCDRALLGAYAEGKATVDRRIVEKAAGEMFGRPARLAQPHWPLGLGLGAAAVLAGLALWAFVDAGWQRDSRAAPRSDTGPQVPPGALAHASPASTTAPAPATAASAAPAAAGASRTAAAPPAVGGDPGAFDNPPVAAPPARPEPQRTVLRALSHDEKDAWRELASLWKLSLDGGDPCQAAQQQQVHCFRGSSSLVLIRQLGRPGILTLRDESDQPAYVLLTGLSGQHAILQTGNGRQKVPLDVLAQVWRGEYATFWRAPAGYVSGVVDDRSGPLADWLAKQLATAQGQPRPPARQARDAATLRSRISAFQVAHGLKPDGRAGPTTLMQLNRSLGVDEPRLQVQ